MIYRTVQILLTLSLLVGSASAGALDAKKVLGKTPILYTLRAPDRDGTHAYMRPRCFLKMGASLKALDPSTGKTRVLVSAPKGMIRRPCVNFDGKRVVFSMCLTGQDVFHIYEITIDPARLFTDTGLCKPKQLTFAPDVYDVDPIYLPDGKIAFCSTRDIKIVPCAGQLVPQMFRMDPDGANIHQITRSTVHENEPSLMPDGRILYNRWDYVDRNFGDGHGFWVANPDGTNQAIIWGNNTAHPASPWTARAIPGTGKFICILGTHHGSLGGALAIINPQISVDGRKSIERTWPQDVITRFDNPQKLSIPKNASAKLKGIGKMTSIWPDEARALLPQNHNYRLHGWNDNLNTVKPWYNCPFPINSTQFLYVVAPQRRIGAEIRLGDVNGNDAKIHAEKPGCYDPMPLAPHPKPVAMASTRDYADNDGHFYIQNVYIGTHMKHVTPGSVKHVRVVQAHSKRGKSGHIWRALGHQEGAIGWSGFIAKTVLGTAPVEKDGSASFYVPSDRFVYFQLLDEDGMMIHSMRTGTSVHSGERRGCVGCHESRSATTSPGKPTELTKALKRTPSKLNPWLGKPRRFGYLAEVQPVLDKHCIKCHDFGKKGAKKIVLAGDKNFGFNVSYCEIQSRGLTGAIGAGPAGHLPALTWGSKTSRLIKMLKKGHKKVKLSAEDMDRLVTWIDLNAPYYPTGYSARPGPMPGRNPLDRGQSNRLFALAGLSANQLHKADLYAGPQVCFDRPEISPCLKRIKAPAKRAEALKIIQAGKASLEKLPRADMPGFATLHAADQKRKEHYEKYRRIEQQVRKAIREGRKIYDSKKANKLTMGL
ncbi:MAG: hypothetical protein HN350_00415 [Phycisphaerales bacterium]|nr:hypothetical protein [Phycisphaerales bacterium]